MLSSLILASLLISARQFTTATANATLPSHLLSSKGSARNCYTTLSLCVHAPSPIVPLFVSLYSFEVNCSCGASEQPSRNGHVKSVDVQLQRIRVCLKSTSRSSCLRVSTHILSSWQQYLVSVRDGGRLARQTRAPRCGRRALAVAHHPAHRSGRFAAHVFRPCPQKTGGQERESERKRETVWACVRGRRRGGKKGETGAEESSKRDSERNGRAETLKRKKEGKTDRQTERRRYKLRGGERGDWEENCREKEESRKRNKRGGRVV